jgi:hypothetical protein
VGKPERRNGFGDLGFILSDFLLLRSMRLPAGSQVPAIRTEQASCWGESRVTLNRKDSSSHEGCEKQRLHSFVMIAMPEVYITIQTPKRRSAVRSANSQDLLLLLDNLRIGKRNAWRQARI